MHATNGTGTSLPDYLFFLFLPPSHSCMDDVLAKLAAASRPAEPDPSGAEFSKSELQVTYSCSYAPTLSDFYSQQLTTGITFRQALNGPRAYGDFKNLEMPPMEQVDFAGMTFFVFEALSHEQISENAVHYFNLPTETQGLHADFFWAIGTTKPVSIRSRPQLARTLPSFISPTPAQDQTAAPISSASSSASAPSKSRASNRSISTSTSRRKLPGALAVHSVPPPAGLS